MAGFSSGDSASGGYDLIDSGSGWESGRPSQLGSAVYLHPKPENPRGPSRRLLPDRPGPFSRDRPPGSLTYLRPVPSQEELRDFEDRTKDQQLVSRFPQSPPSKSGFVNGPQRVDASWVPGMGAQFDNDRRKYPSWDWESSGVDTTYPSSEYPSLRERGSISFSEASYDNSFYRYSGSDNASYYNDNADTSSFFDERVSCLEGVCVLSGEGRFRSILLCTIHQKLRSILSYYR